MKAAPPSPATHPNTFAWFVLCHRFSDAARALWGGAAPAKAAAKPAPAKKEEPKKEEPKKEAAKPKADDDDMDLFGDDDEDDAVSDSYLIASRLPRLPLRPARRRPPRSR